MSKNLTVSIFVFLSGIHFVYLPFLGGINGLSKQYVFIFFSVVFFLFHLKNNPRISFPYISPLCFLFFLFALISVLLSHNIYDSALAYFSLCLGFLYCIFIYNIALSNVDLKFYVVNSLIFSGVVAAVLGLYQFSHFILMGQTEGWLIVNLLPGIQSLRVSGVYGQANLFALFLTISLLAFFYRYIHFPNCNVCFLRFVPVALVSFVFFLTGSRAGTISFVLVFGCLFWLFVSKRYLFEKSEQGREFKYLILSLILSFIISKICLFLISSSAFSARDFVTTGQSVDARFIFWTAAILIFIEHPLVGVGLDNYKFFLANYQEKAHDILGFVDYESMVHTKWAHNEFLQILAEGGVFVFLITLILLIIFLIIFVRNYFFKKNIQDPWPLYIQLLIFPFIIQSLFSYPLRYAPLIVLFWTFVGFLLASYKGYCFNIVRWVRVFSIVFFVLIILFTAGLFYQESKVGQFRLALSNKDSVPDQIDLFISLANNPFSKGKVLQHGLIPLSEYVLEHRNIDLASALLPYAEEAAYLQGVYWQWYYLSRLYLLVGRKEMAFDAIQEAINRRPSFDYSWFFLHYLNVLTAAEKTGRSVESFYRPGSGTLEYFQ